MRVLSNVEFETLVEGQSPRLKTLAKQRCVQSPTGFLTIEDIATYTKACEYSGDKASSSWLKNLAVLAKNGKLQRIRTGANTWADHVEHVHALYAAKSAPFNIGQHVFVDDVGRYGSIADYIPDTEEYLVILDPFQVKTYKKKDLEKVAKVINSALKSNLAIGDRVFIEPFISGIDSGKHGVIVAPDNVKTDGRGVPTNIPGAYKPVDWSEEFAIELDDGTLITMFKDRVNQEEVQL